MLDINDVRHHVIHNFDLFTQFLEKLCECAAWGNTLLPVWQLWYSVLYYWQYHNSNDRLNIDYKWSLARVHVS